MEKDTKPGKQSLMAVLNFWTEEIKGKKKKHTQVTMFLSKGKIKA